MMVSKSILFDTSSDIKSGVLFLAIFLIVVFRDVASGC